MATHAFTQWRSHDTLQAPEFSTKRSPQWKPSPKPSPSKSCRHLGHGKPCLPDDQYAIVELMGHTTLVGRVTEIERFGAKLIEVLFGGRLLPVILQGGASVYRSTSRNGPGACRILT